MIQEWFDKNIFLYIILGICGVGIFIKFVLSMKYRLLIRASKRMGTSKNRLMRVLRLKFETCYKLNIGVNNVDTFVDKYVYRYRFGGILLYTWETISGEIIILSVLSGSIFSILGLLAECEINNILSTLIAGVLGALVLISYDHFINLNMKRKVLKVNIRDYLENFLKSRLENGEFSSNLLEQYKKEYLELPNKKAKKKSKKNENSKSIPDLVAQIESAATAVDLTSVKDRTVLVNCEKAEDEFDDAKLFLEPEEAEVSPKQIEAVQMKELKKDKSKKKLKPEKEAELRREAKKNELKRMILEDKEIRHRTMPEFFPAEPEQEQPEEQEHSKHVAEELNPFSRPAAELTKSVEKKTIKEITENPVHSKKDTVKKDTVKKDIAKKEITKKEVEDNNKKTISSEEAQIIEDILREYLA